MITCPWCGTNYAVFQPNCTNCGGPLPTPRENPPAGAGTVQPEEPLLMPPPAPRPFSNSYTWKLLMSDGWAIAAFVFILLGGIFTVTGIGLTVAIITAFVGIPFAGLGLLDRKSVV